MINLFKAIRNAKPKIATGNYPFYCPSCESKLIPSEYCGNCGQRINWEETKKRHYKMT